METRKKIWIDEKLKILKYFLFKKENDGRQSLITRPVLLIIQNKMKCYKSKTEERNLKKIKMMAIISYIVESSDRKIWRRWRLKKFKFQKLILRPPITVNKNWTWNFDFRWIWRKDFRNKHLVQLINSIVGKVGEKSQILSNLTAIFHISLFYFEGNRSINEKWGWWLVQLVTWIFDVMPNQQNWGRQRLSLFWN